MILPELPLRPENGNKGTFGRVLVVAGSHEMIGAPAMAGTAALRMGAGIVQVVVPNKILLSVLSITPELIGLALTRRSEKKLSVAAQKSDSIVLGPGLGQTPEAKKRVMQMVQQKKLIVVDADALNLISKLKRGPSFFNAEAVLTPHPGEMLRLKVEQVSSPEKKWANDQRSLMMS
jgi:hydroxyethylthiazole kinase-like uncharacterized protein yjeF